MHPSAHRMCHPAHVSAWRLKDLRSGRQDLHLRPDASRAPRLLLTYYPLETIPDLDTGLLRKHRSAFVGGASRVRESCTHQMPCIRNRWPTPSLVPVVHAPESNRIFRP